MPHFKARTKKRHVISDINVTPMIDVMLVLLVIFMITAPLLTSGVKVDLPKSQAQSISDNEEPLVISIKSDGTLFIGDVLVSTDTLIDKLVSITHSNKDTRLYLYADRSLNYERVMETISTINTAGFKKIALISDSTRSTKQKLHR